MLFNFCLGNGEKIIEKNQQKLKKKKKENNKNNQKKSQTLSLQFHYFFSFVEKKWSEYTDYELFIDKAYPTIYFKIKKQEKKKKKN